MDEAIETCETPYNSVAVIPRGERIDFDVEGATFASWHPRHLCTGYSWDAVTAACLAGKATPKSVLVLGLAGGTCTRQLRHLLPDAEITAVEIDGALVELARKHMGLDDQRLKVAVQDAYAFLAETSEKFDAVVDDLFLCGEEDVVRSKVPEGEVLESLVARVAPGGVLAANVITDFGHDLVAAATLRAFGHAFADSYSVIPPRGLNAVVVGGAKLRAFAEVRALATRFDEESDRQLWRAMRADPNPHG